MPKVIVCTYCYEEIDEEKDKYMDVPNRAGEVAHPKCYQKANDDPERPLRSIPPSTRR